MPLHDWTRVSAGTFHDFHVSWIGVLKRVLNAGLLPRDYYAMAEQVTGEMGPDVIALHARNPNGDLQGGAIPGATAVAEAPPREEAYALKRRTLTIRHTSGDEVVAIIEIISPGNKSGAGAVERQVDKIASAIASGISVLVVDLFPPGRHDPHGLHGAYWEYAHGGQFTPPSDAQITLVAYSPGQLTTAYVQSLAVCQPLPDMPLFLNDAWYVNVPLETTYNEAYDSVPRRWREVIEGDSETA